MAQAARTIQETPTLECVDDPASTHYNRLVHRDRAATVDWSSSEKMAQVGEAYRWGVVIEYNTASPVPGHGSCVFLHISPTPGQGTAGCTAMASPALDELMRWLGSGAPAGAGPDASGSAGTARDAVAAASMTP